MLDDTTVATKALGEIWGAASGDIADLEHVTIEGVDPQFPSPFRVGTAAAASVGGAALAAARLWQARTGHWQHATVSMRHAGAVFRSERYLRVGDTPPADPWDPFSGYYRTGDGCWVQLHTNFPHHRDRALRVLGLDPVRARERADAERAMLSWTGQAIEDALAEAGGCGYLARTPEEWRAHQQARALAALPPLDIGVVGDGPVRHLARDGTMPLAGIRVLDMSRVVAGPVAGRTLAAYGAEVIRVGAAHLPEIPLLVIDTGFGKRFVHLDLRTSADRARFEALAASADVVIQAYRPGALDALGYGASDLVRMRPGVVVVSLSAWSHEGPWANRRGFDSLVQTASGLLMEGTAWAVSDRPTPLPAQALDHATGYLAAMGAMLSLVRQTEHGGSRQVRVALARTGQWFDRLGRTDGRGVADPTPDALADLFDEMDSDFGRLRFVRPAGWLDETPPRWSRPPGRPGAEARW